MSFVIRIGFITEQESTAFIEKVLPKVRAKQVDTPEAEGAEPDPLQRVSVAVTSASAAKELCHQLVAFLAHSKTGRINVDWTGADGQSQGGQVVAGEAREAEMLAVRLSNAARTSLKVKDEG